MIPAYSGIPELARKATVFFGPGRILLNAFSHVVDVAKTVLVPQMSYPVFKF
jgi:hypothetical protein